MDEKIRERVYATFAYSDFARKTGEERHKLRQYKIETHIEVLFWMLENDEMPDELRTKIKKRLKYWLDAYERDYVI